MGAHAAHPSTPQQQRQTPVSPVSPVSPVAPVERSHQVLTAIGVGVKDKIQVRLSTSTVRFREISEREIRNYLANNNILDKAGAYAIQGMAAAFIVEISGSYSGIMGLPLYETAQLLEEIGIGIFQ